MNQIVDIKRLPITPYHSNFRGCRICRGRRNCCKSLPFPVRQHVLLHIKKDYTTWTELEMKIWEIRQHGGLIRLVVEKDIPNSILWAVSYDSHNLIQINVDLLSSIDDWVTHLAHATERCGLYVICMLYPIIPGITKPQDVLKVIDTLRSMPYCLVTLKFAEFKNSGRLSSSTHLNVNGFVIPKEHLNQIRIGKWECNETYKTQFVNLIKRYSEFQHIHVESCGR